MTRRKYIRLGNALAKRKHQANLIRLNLASPSRTATKQELDNYHSQLSKLLEYITEINGLLMFIQFLGKDIGNMLVNSPLNEVRILNKKAFEKLLGRISCPQYVYDGNFCKCVSAKRFNKTTYYIYTTDIAKL